LGSGVGFVLPVRALAWPHKRGVMVLLKDYRVYSQKPRIKSSTFPLPKSSHRDGKDSRVWSGEVTNTRERGEVMMKKKCSLCQRSQGKRICQVRENAPICPICCATHRNQECEGCRYYVQAQHHQQEKLQSSSPRHFIIEVNPEVEETVDQALELIEQQRYQQAEQLLTHLLPRHPRNHLVQYGFGTLAATQGDLDRAIQHFEQATQIFPYFVEAQFNKAVAYQQKLDIRGMIEAFRGVIAIGDPQDACVRQSQEILTDFAHHVKQSEGISLDSYLEGQEFFERGVSCFTKQSWEQAIQWFRKSLAITPEHPQSYGNIGLCYGFLGHKRLALEAFDKALELDPHYELAIVNRAIVEQLPEGECLSPEDGQVVEYYKDYPLQNRSYLEEFTQQLHALQDGQSNNV
jgi:tetratricopeptide (TPR) repeat protein